jgi:hypothetical protein
MRSHGIHDWRRAGFLGAAFAVGALAIDEQVPLDSVRLFDEWTPAGPIMRVSEKKYKASRKDGDLYVERNWTVERTLDFDRDGRVVASRFEVRTAMVSEDLTFTYDDRGNVTRVQVRVEAVTETATTTYTFRRDVSGLVVEFSDVDKQANVDGRVLVEYGPDGHIARRSVYQGGTLQLQSVGYRYGSLGELVRRVDVRGGSDTTVVTSSTTTDSVSTARTETHARVSGAVVAKYLTVFNPAGQLMRREEDQGAIHSEHARWYDRGGRVLEWVELRNGTQEDRHTYTYDSRGLLTERIDYSPGNTVERRRSGYRYDAYGNWVRFLEDDRGSLKVFKRTIEYYPAAPAAAK